MHPRQGEPLISYVLSINFSPLALSRNLKAVFLSHSTQWRRSRLQGASTAHVRQKDPDMLLSMLGLQEKEREGMRMVHKEEESPGGAEFLKWGKKDP